MASNAGLTELKKELRWVKHQLAQVRPYVRHKQGCNSEHPMDPGPCDCGYEHLLKLLGWQKPNLEQNRDLRLVGRVLLEATQDQIREKSRYRGLAQTQVRDKTRLRADEVLQLLRQLLSLGYVRLNQRDDRWQLTRPGQTAVRQAVKAVEKR